MILPNAICADSPSRFVSGSDVSRALLEVEVPDLVGSAIALGDQAVHVMCRAARTGEEERCGGVPVSGKRG